MSVRFLGAILLGLILGACGVLEPERVREYSLLELSEWREQLRPTIWGSGDVTGLGLDEVTRRLTVYVKPGTGNAAEIRIRAAARGLGIPQDALQFRFREALKTAVGVAPI